jgi:hypothetical protein
MSAMYNQHQQPDAFVDVDGVGIVVAAISKNTEL